MRVREVSFVIGKIKVNFAVYSRDQIKDFQQQDRRSLMIVCPGGGYTMLSDRESEIVALQFMAQGMNALILRYALISGEKPVYPDPLIQVGAAVQFAKRHADALEIDPDKVNLIGFSAGGHVAAMYAASWNKSWLLDALDASSEELRIRTQILCYPVINFNYGWPSDQATVRNIQGDFPSLEADKLVNQDNIPTFIWNTATDGTVPAKNTIAYQAALNAHHIPFEAHVFRKGRHGLSLANRLTAPPDDRSRQYIDTHVAKWLPAAIDWLRAFKQI
ncbi:MAG: alpha/beta hydrolase [Sporolactobacillus sp.]|jgi:acetyl esterase/lipase|nr:alpha/beta hydrolase [Sporolactobacillus sp.]